MQKRWRQELCLVHKPLYLCVENQGGNRPIQVYLGKWPLNDVCVPVHLRECMRVCLCLRDTLLLLLCM